MLCFCSQCRLWLTDAARSLASPPASRSAEPGEGARQRSARRAGGSGPHGARESQELSVSRSPVKMEQVAHGSRLCRRWESHAGVAVGRRPKDSAHFEWGGGPHRAAPLRADRVSRASCSAARRARSQRWAWLAVAQPRLQTRPPPPSCPSP